MFEHCSVQNGVDTPVNVIYFTDKERMNFCASLDKKNSKDYLLLMVYF